MFFDVEELDVNLVALDFLAGEVDLREEPGSSATVTATGSGSGMSSPLSGFVSANA